MTYGWLNLIVSRPVLMVLAALGGAVGLGLLQRGCAPPAPPAIVAQEPTRTAPAPDTRKWDEPRETPPPYVIQVLSPPDRERRRIGERLDRPDLNRAFTPENIEAQRQLGIITQAQADAAMAAYREEQERLAKENRALKDRIIQFERELVARRAIPAAPWGGTATATTSRITGVTDIDFERRSRPRVNWLWDFGIGARYEWSTSEIENVLTGAAYGDTTAQTVDVHVFAEPVEFGRTFPTVLRVEAGYERMIEGDFEGKGWKGSVWLDTHFNRDRRVREHD